MNRGWFILSIVGLSVILCSNITKVHSSSGITGVLNRLIKTHKIEAIDTNLLIKEHHLDFPKPVVSLGRKLFNDVQLSKNKNISCATCHMQNKGLSNSVSLGKGTHGTSLSRNVPHLYNAALGRTFFWDGRATSLEEQLEMVISSKDELDMDFKELVTRLRSDTNYIADFKLAFPEEEISKKTIKKALVSYEKTLLAGNSRYDLFISGDTLQFSEAEKQGFLLFTGKANCIACHKGSNLTDNTFHNVGVRTTDVGRQLVDKVGMSKEFESTPYPFFSTFKAFKTPSLRNVEFSGPYFHDGSKATLRQVIEFYNKGGENPDKTGLAKEIIPLNLTDNEISNLESFLLTFSSKKGY